jgi:hypothetical protein
MIVTGIFPFLSIIPLLFSVISPLFLKLYYRISLLQHYLAALALANALWQAGCINFVETLIIFKNTTYSVTVFFLFALLRYRIVSATAPGMTTGNAFYAKPCTFYWSVFFKCFNGIYRTCRSIATGTG